jgi:hypothetical protein
LNRYTIALFLLVFSINALGGVAEASPQFSLQSAETVVSKTPSGTLTGTEWRLTYDDMEPVQAVGLHRYRNPDRPSRAVLLYLPGTNMNGSLKTADERYNLWMYLAARGVEVYTVDYRTRFIPHDFEGDLAFMRDWTFDRFVRDALRCVEEIKSQVPDRPLFVAGFSRGASYAYALVGQMEAAGLIVLDGSFKQVNPKVYDLPAALTEFDDEARYATPVSRRGYEARHELMTHAYEDPSGPAMDERYETAESQLAETLHKAWGAGVLTNTRDSVSPITVLAREMDDYDWYFPSIQNVESRAMSSQIDDPATVMDDHFGEMTLPILFFGSGNFGTELLLNGIHSAARSGSKDVTIRVLEDFGHLDVLFAHSAVDEVYEVTLKWILARLPGGGD